MIISASRRTDIPAFYSEWLMNRIRAGFCTTVNPFNPKQVSIVSLRPQDTEVIVFWTRYAKPLFPHLSEIDRRGFRYYFQYTVMDNPRLMDPGSPSLEKSIATFKRLAEHVGADRVIWRYDPIVLSNVTDIEYHHRAFTRIADALKDVTQRVVISIIDLYRSAATRMKALESRNIFIRDVTSQDLAHLVGGLAEMARQHGLTMQSCAEEIDLRPYGVMPGKCIDDGLIREIFRITVSAKKDPSQRKQCGCVVSKDIGMYDTCLFNCAYCYATRSCAAVRCNRKQHDPKSPSLVGWHEPTKGKSQDDDGQLTIL